MMVLPVLLETAIFNLFFFQEMFSFLNNQDFSQRIAFFLNDRELLAQEVF